jgi:ribonuclease VapC
MVIDTSALLAILLGEPEEVRFAEILERESEVRMSAASYMEAAMIIDRRVNAEHREMLDGALKVFGIKIEPVTEEQARVARRAFQEFGRGAHPAGLNYGDCFTYALAKVTQEKLLFKGNDFTKTDLLPAFKPSQ